MCSICGCGSEAPAAEAAARHSHPHDHDHAHGHAHAHTHRLDHDHDHDHDHGHAPAAAHAPGLSPARMLRIERDIMAKNDGYAAANRQRLAQQGIFAVNLMSSPGSGKTTLLVRLIAALGAATRIAVIEGDQQTDADAARIRATGAPAVQINTGKGCHLDAHMVGHALDSLELAPNQVLFIENVGNLVCPAGFDLGEAARVVVLSVTEGEDKPLKYPDMFAAAELMVLNKSDLLPYVDFDVARCIAHALRVNPHLQVLTLSARTGEGLAPLCAWIEARAALAAIPAQAAAD